MRTYDVSRAELQQQDVALIRGRVATDRIPEFLGGVFGEVMGAINQQGRRPAGMPFGRYRQVEGGDWEVEAGFPVDGPVSPQGRVEPSTLPGGPVARVLHRGTYDTVGAAYEAAVRSIEDSGDRVTGDPWECYLDEPGVPEPRTEVFVPCDGPVTA